MRGPAQAADDPAGEAAHTRTEKATAAFVSISAVPVGAAGLDIAAIKRAKISP